jgi:adhesin/invasin
MKTGKTSRVLGALALLSTAGGLTPGCSTILGLEEGKPRANGGSAGRVGTGGGAGKSSSGGSAGLVAARGGTAGAGGGGTAGATSTSGATSTGGSGLGAGGSDGGKGATGKGGSSAVSGMGGSIGGASGEGGEAGAQSGAAGMSENCSPSCTSGNLCIAGECKPCGAAAEPCCDGSCGANLTCGSQQMCVCGDANEPCCGGSGCNEGLTCDPTGQCTCGSLGISCCASDPEPTCSDGLNCAGTRCSCIAKIAVADLTNQDASHASPLGALVLRTDGTVWQFNAYAAAQKFTQVVTTNQLPLVASDLDIGMYDGSFGGTSYGHVGCAVADGSVWCFPSSTVNDSTFLGAGLGASDTTSFAVQVLTGVGGSPLAGITQIAANKWSAVTFCAVASDGSVWCWGSGGRGILGRGDTATSSFARKVLAAPGTPLADAVEVTVGTYAACVRKQDGSVWCWGGNGGGELGDAGVSGDQYYPVNVPFVGSSDQRTAVQLVKGPHETFCAIMKDSSVTCWGYDGAGQAGAPPPSAANLAAPPSPVLVASGGPALTKALDLSIEAYAGVTCARNQDLDVLCWGSGNPYARPYLDASNTVVSGIRIPFAGAWAGFGYVNPVGTVIVAGVNSPLPDACDGQ